jgi:tetratricopeptide (TPR) repeat protein
LELKPSILARGKKPGEAAAALRQALEAFKIFALPQHWEKLAAYEAEAGRTQQAVEILNKRLSETNWPIKQLELLNLKHNHQMKAGDLDGANATNKDIAQRFPGTRVAVSAELRTAGNLLGVKKFQEARSALSTTMKTYAKDADLAAMLSGAVNDCVAGLPEAEGLALREEFIATYPASAQADDYRKALKLELKDTATVQAKALFDEYRSFAKENNVDAARRRIDRLFAEFPTSSCGADAAAELAAALKKADKVELAAELNLLVGQKCPYRYRAEELLRDAADSYNGAAKPDLALKAYDLLVKGYRTSQYWRDYVLGAAATLDKQGKVEEIRTFLNNVAEKLGDGPEAVDLKAYMARRLEAQNKWVDAAYEMLKIMGPRAADPAYRPLTGEAFMYVYVGQLDDKEIKLLDDLAAKYEGWDEADRIRISLAGSYARKKETAQALKMLRDIAKRHPNYEMGATGQGMVQYRSQYERGLFWGTVGRHPVERVEDDMSGGWGNYLYAATIEDMVDYVLLLNEPQAYVDRVTQRLGQLMNAKSKRPQNYKSGLPYRTKNVPKPRWHPWPEQRKCYLLAVAIDDGLHHMTRHVDPAVWLEVYPLWPHYFLNDERITDAAGGLVTNKPLFQRALAILKENYNPLTWEPYILNAMAGAERQGGSSSVAAQLYRELFTRYPDHELAANAAKAFQDLGGRV